jgi:serine/threonine protein kinase/Tol biopolymer transport system component
MDRERWRQIDSIFKSALELSSDERADFIKRACAGDEELCAEVESLIAHDREGDELEEPAFEEATRLLAAEAQKEQALAGKIVGPYRIVSRIGVGGMGEVYLAVHERTGRKVALKLLPAHHTRDEQRVRRFQQEARAVLALNHPNIVTVYDIEQADGASVIASEFIEGETLRARLSRGPLAAADALDVAAQVAAALSAAHAAGIVHRDIKPENVMLRPDGFVKVLDFGLAKLTERPDGAGSSAPTLASVNTDPGVVLGTVSYMSPEQARGLEVDARTDIWSLGVVLYEMATGRVPFVGETPTDVLASIIGKEPPPLARYLKAVPETLEWIVTKTLTKDREGRYQTARELLTDLKRLKQQLEFEAVAERSGEAATADTGAGAHSGDAAAQRKDASQSGGTTGGAGGSTSQIASSRMQTTTPLDTAARTTSSAEYIVEEIKRHRLGAAIVAMFASLALIAGALGLYRLFRRGQSAPFQTMQLTRLSDTSQAVETSVSPRGDFVVFIKEEAGRQSLWLRQTSAASSVQIAPPAEGVRYAVPVFSRAGDFIFYLKSDKPGPRMTLYRMATLGGGETKLIEDISTFDTRSNFSLSPDGKQAAFVRLDAQLQRSLVIADLEGGGERVLLARRLPRFVAAPQWSPDGQTIACIDGNFDSRGVPGGDRVVLGVRVADGVEVNIPNQNWSQLRSLTWIPDSSGLVVSASEKHGGPLQLWHLAYPDGTTRRITNDLSDYAGVSLTADSSSLASVQINQRLNIWTATPEKNSWSLAQLTDGEGRHDGEFGVSWAGEGRVVYHSMAGGKSDIWAVDGAGHQRQLTSGGGVNLFPSASPDGRYIVFGSDRSGVSSLWRMDSDGSHPKQLTSDGSIPRCSPDGQWVYYYMVGILFKVSIEGGTPVKIQIPDKDLAASPVLSPDGRLIACNYLVGQPGAQFRLAVIPAEGGSPLRIFDTPTGPIKPLRWTPDGRAILYILRRDGVGNIWSQPLDGGPAVPLTSFTSDDINNFDIAPDGRLVLSRGGATSSVVILGGWQ